MSNSLLSSEQALDDYFAALLEEELDEPNWQDGPFSTTLISHSIDDPQPQPARQRSAESYIDQELVEFELPNLDDVQRLLSQLESSNPVAELDLEVVMAENTTQIAQTVTETVVEEIQEWDIEETLVESDPVITIEEPELFVEEPSLQPLEAEPEVIIEPVMADDTLVTEDTKPDPFGIGQWQCPIREQNFQVLYFDVNGVTFAVPLDELGGIHRKATLNHLIGRPAWYLGLQTNRDSQLDVVDTAKWVMSDKLADDTYKKDYQYIVMLDNSLWGLACTKLLGTEWLSSDKVRWREQVGKRPWLAGMVKEKMCALIHVHALIAMLNAGLDVQALDK
ncbi:chemotaxis protein CheW [Vibrio metschnikovii]|uniref:chemotaxis protein CheW n=1 Tax=Vibrio metschnikovii TaxID=28172 RepID=UPI001C30E247|nr:chemotaxis protein CheW [Vibrio metschnikovii]